MKKVKFKLVKGHKVNNIKVNCDGLTAKEKSDLMDEMCKQLNLKRNSDILILDFIKKRDMHINSEYITISNCTDEQIDRFKCLYLLNDYIVFDLKKTKALLDTSNIKGVHSVGNILCIELKEDMK